MGIASSTGVNYQELMIVDKKEKDSISLAAPKMAQEDVFIGYQLNVVNAERTIDPAIILNSYVNMKREDVQEATSYHTILANTEDSVAYTYHDITYADTFVSEGHVLDKLLANKSNDINIGYITDHLLIDKNQEKTAMVIGNTLSDEKNIREAIDGTHRIVSEYSHNKEVRVIKSILSDKNIKDKDGLLVEPLFVDDMPSEGRLVEVDTQVEILGSEAFQIPNQTFVDTFGKNVRNMQEDIRLVDTLGKDSFIEIARMNVEKLAKDFTSAGAEIVKANLMHVDADIIHRVTRGELLQ